jgi:hypothetical protein
MGEIRIQVQKRRFTAEAQSAENAEQAGQRKKKKFL